MDNLLSVYQHPALSVLIDDSQSFLDSLAFQLNPQLALKKFHNPQAAINWLQHAHFHFSQNENDLIHVGYDEQSDSFERRSASIDLNRIYHLVLNRQRFEIPAVLVIDYAMPQMNGVEFCHAIQELPCKKILLTGQADDSIAIDAFNRKLIDCFIKKSDPNAPSRLETEIVKLQKAFFNVQTSTLKDLLSRHSYSFLTDSAMGALVEQLSSRYRFVEFYLFPNPAGILFFDVHGKATLMVIQTASSLITQLEIAQDQDAPPELLNALRELRLVPFFSDTDGVYRNTIGQDWLSYCLPPQLCQGRENYFWALFDLPPQYLQDPVYSYANFLHDQSGDFTD
jgi:CheY-like chemotaxis protein